MATIQHGGLTLDIPADWADRSTLLFVAPRPKDELPTTAAVQRPTEAVAVNFMPAGSDDPRAVLRAQAEQLRAVNPDLEILEERAFECGLGTGWCNIQRLTVFDTPVRQMCVVCITGPVAVVATASAAETRFGRCEDMLLSILQTLGSANR